MVKPHIAYVTRLQPYANSTFALISLIFGWATPQQDWSEKYIRISPMSSCSKIWWKYNLHKLKKLKKTVKSLLSVSGDFFYAWNAESLETKGGQQYDCAPNPYFLPFFERFLTEFWIKYAFMQKKRIFMNKNAFLVGRGGKLLAKPTKLHSQPLSRKI